MFYRLSVKTTPMMQRLASLSASWGVQLRVPPETHEIHTFVVMRGLNGPDLGSHHAEKREPPSTADEHFWNLATGLVCYRTLRQLQVNFNICLLEGFIYIFIYIFCVCTFCVNITSTLISAY